MIAYLIWMYNEAKRLNIDTHAGLILDEMAIQEDLKMGFANKTNNIDGLTDWLYSGKYSYTEYT